MIPSTMRLLSEKWHTRKGMFGLLFLAIAIGFWGAQIQSWLDAGERTSIRQTCEMDIAKAKNQSKQDGDVLKQVKGLSDQILQAQQDFLREFNKRKGVTDHIARKVEQIDLKASAAAVESKAAKEVAQQTASAVYGAVKIGPKMAADVNEQVRKTNRGSK